MILGIETYQVLLPLALILALAKMFGVISKRIGLPQVVGMLAVGIILGLLRKIPFVSEQLITNDGVEGISFIAEIGVILIMYSAGLSTDVKQIKASGKSAIAITSLGVIVPLLFGFLVAGFFQGFSGEVVFAGKTVNKVYSNLFYGVILTATSVSVTIQTLKELGKLNSKVGTCVVSAAIIDDVIGVVVLSVVLSIANGSTAEIGFVILKTIGFFVCSILVGILMRLLFKHLEAKYPHHRRLPIYGLAFCFFLSFISERAFGIADITGAYVAGLILAGRTSTSYLERRTDIASYIIFTPVFFAKIGITTEWKPIDPQFLGFGIAFILAGILGKLFGCGLGAKVTGLSLKDSYRSGVGMMCRAEVCLICAQKGIDAGLINPNIQIFIIILIIVTSFAVPLLLKLSDNNDKDDSNDNDTKSQIIEDGETFVKNVNEAEVEIPRVGTNLGDL